MITRKPINIERDTIFDEWLRTEVLAAVADKRSSAPIDKVFKRVRAKISRASNDRNVGRVGEA